MASRSFTLIALVSLAIQGEFLVAEEHTMSDLLRDALRQGEAVRVGTLVAADKDTLDARSEHGFTPLMLAALLADAATVEALLKAGADVDAVNEFGGQALNYAAYDLSKTRLLVEAGADVNHATQIGHTPIFSAVRDAFASDAVRYLVERGAKVDAISRFGVTPLMVAANAGNLEVVRFLLKNGADASFVNPKAEDLFEAHITLSSGSKARLLHSGGSALDQALRLGHLDVGRELVKAGAKSEKPLFVATFFHRPRMMRFAIEELGAKPDDETLYLAATNDYGSDEAVRIALEANADPKDIGPLPTTATMGVRESALVPARRRGLSPAVRALVEAGVPERADWWKDKKRVPPKRDIDPDSVTQRDLVVSILGATPLLERTVVQGAKVARLYDRNNDRCVSCHNQLLPLIALGEAKLKGVPLVPERFEEARETVDTYIEPTEIQLKTEVTFEPAPAQKSPLTVWAMLKSGLKPKLRYDAEVHTVAQYQLVDGSWPSVEKRSPIMDSDLTATALAIRTLASYPMPGRKTEFAERIERGKAFLQRANVRSAEEAAQRLMGLYWAGVPARELQEYRAELLRRQKPDGGWTSSPYLEDSDSYGTGQALYALREVFATGLESDDFRRGVLFLLRTQLSDGSWFIRRRAIPFQNTMDPQFPHGRDAWISAAGTSWAVLALAASLDQATVASILAEKRPVRFERREAKLPPLPPVFDGRANYTDDIEPLLEESCAGCHNRAPSIRSGFYDMRTRAGLIRGNSFGPDVVIPGKSADSPLVKHVAGHIEDVEMPPLPHRRNYDPLTPQEIGKLRRWIDDGLPGLE